MSGRIASAGSIAGSFVLLFVVFSAALFGLTYVPELEAFRSDLALLLGAAFVLALIPTIFLIVRTLRRRAELRRQERERLQREEVERRRRQRQAALENRQKEEAHKQRQAQLAQSLEHAVSQSRSLLPMLTTSLAQASQRLTQAKQEYADGAFAPFWVAIEKTSAALEAYSVAIATIEKNALDYRELKAEFGGNPPSLHVVTAYPDPTRIVNQMKALVLKARRDFQFAAIYDQRRTDALLQVGLMRLASALDGLGTRFANAIGNLGGRVEGAVDQGFEAQVEAASRQEASIAASEEGARRADAAREEAIRRAEASLARERHQEGQLREREVSHKLGTSPRSPKPGSRR